MLKSIEKIKKLGVYENCTKPAGIKEFAAKNLIYGWNYSGKTTLSRLFAKLEAKAPHPDFKDCEFTFNGGADAITEKNFHECDLSIRVFNSDFVRNNLFFELGNCNAILLLGKESEEAQKKIDTLSKRIDESNQSIRKIGKKCDGYTEAIQEEKKKSAQNIRQRLKVDPYNATHLTSDIQAISLLDETQSLSDKDLSDAIELALTPDSKKPLVVDEIFGSPSIETLHKDAVGVLSATPSFSNTIKHLEENPEIERWVESGLHLHLEAGTCEFCGNRVTQDRLDAFRSHFSKDLADHKAKVQRLFDRVKISEFKLDVPKAVELNPQFRDAYQTACEPLAGHIKAFNAAVKTLADEVAAKVENSRKAMEPSPLPKGLETAIVDTIKAINAVIKENNQLAANFVNARAEARGKAKNHFVQEAADKLENEGWERKKTVLTRRSDRLRGFSGRLQADVDRLQAEISQAQQGRERINERLVSMLGSEAIQITVTKDGTGHERFQLVRKNGAVAKNLSDGERTAIAFCYFLTKLKELKDEDFKRTIVYIDDPISSLDSNHIFQVTAAINDLFFAKIPQPNGSEAWDTTCKQIFISTHNFEFFNLIRELEPKRDAAARLFLVKRKSDGTAELCNMPKSLSNYASEYQFLFDSVYKFHVDENKAEHDQLFILPNALRRFVELYTFSRIPSAQRETVDQRAAELFGKERAKSILKFLHTFSHGNTIERISGNNELIFLLEETVKAVFDEIQEKDERHWKALVAAVVP
ncbi:AAA family ATPase [Burkholderia cepacia]|uniref:AAA family ATPase n=1 Tax=Burkholderia cepacia TaxID=292 RepID=UPI003D67CEAE